jgi:general secretion pathway protein K
MSFAADFRRFSRFSTKRTERTARVSMEAERGWALVSVLWIVSILAMLAAATQALVSTSYRGERQHLESAQADALFEAGVTRAVLGLVDIDAASRWRVDGIPKWFAFDGRTVRIAVQDELGRIDLNATDGSVLHTLFRSAGLDEDQTETIVDRILDWRSPTDLKRLHGATSADYAAAEYPYRPRHGPFQTVDELKLVMGMTPSLFARVEPALTVYTKRPMFDPNVAPREALLALPGYDESRVEDILAARMQTLPSSEGPSNSTGTINPAIGLGGRTFTIAMETRLRHKRFTRTAVVELTGDNNRPYFVLAWE